MLDRNTNANSVTEADPGLAVLVVLLRLAVLLNRGRTPQELPEVRLQVKGRSVSLELPEKWMKEHPLTLEDLEQERAYLKEAGFRLTIV